ncbi:MAG: hypothetical protein KDC38_20345, partial [Planctomycetes bacterium]|nr:hypothetical protein [Planctomycetota bacterium]
MTLEGGLDLLGAGIVVGSTRVGHSSLNANGSQMIGGTGEIVFVESSLGYQRSLTIQGATSELTIGGGVTLRGSDGFINATGSQLVINQGVIRAEGDAMHVGRLSNAGALQAIGGTLDLNAVVGVLGSATVSSGGVLDVDGTYTVDQPITVRDASTLTLRGSWINASSIALADGTVNLGGTFTQATLGSFTRAGGVVNLIGTLDLLGGTLTLDASAGDWVLAGGELLDGTLEMNGATLIPTASGRLTAMTIVGDDWAIPAGRNVTFESGLDLSGVDIVVGGPDAGHTILYFDGTQTLGGSGEIVFTGSPLGYQRYLYLLGTSTQLTIDPAILVRGETGTLLASGGQSFTNLGTIRSEAGTMSVGNIANSGLLETTGGTLDVNGLSGNLGAVAATAGGVLDIDGNYTVDQPVTVRDASTLTLRGNWVNASTIAMTDGTVNLGGTFSLATLGGFSRSGGTVNLIGTLDLGGGTVLFDASSGSWRLQGGTVSNGTVIESGGFGLIAGSSGVLDGITLQGDALVIGPGSIITARNGLTLDATSIVMGAASAGHSYLYLDGTQTIGGNGEIVAVNSGLGYQRLLYLLGAGSTATIGSGITVRGAGATLI